MSARLGIAVLCLGVSAGAFAAGWWRSSSQPAETPAAAAAVDADNEPLLLSASAVQWSARWKEQPEARREVMLQAWMERDPRAALRFLLGLPPGSMSGQAALQKTALLTWSRRDPQAAYAFAASHLRDADYLLEETFKTDPEAALGMLESRVYRNGCSGGPNDWIKSDPANASRRLGALSSSGIKQGSLLNAACEAWAKQDAAAAVEFALTLPEGRASEAIHGIMAGLPDTEAAALTLKLKNSVHLQAAVWTLMVNWGRRDPAAATAWSAEHLPPAALAHAMHCFETNVISGASKESAAAVMAGLTPAAWLALETHIESDKAHAYLDGAPDWMRARLYLKLPGSTESLTEWAGSGKSPDWFQALPAAEASAVVENFAARETRKGKRPLASGVPPQWQESVARGIVERLARDGPPTADPSALPPEERALLRAQLPGLDPAAPHGEALRRRLE